VTKEEDDTAVLLVLGKERKEKEREREPESHRLMKCPKQQQQPNINVYTRKYVCIYK